jgi:hypothetical protein
LLGQQSPEIPSGINICWSKLTRLPRISHRVAAGLNDSCLFEIEFAFNAAPRLITKRILSPQPVNPLALDRNQMPFHFSSLTWGTLFALSRVILLQTIQPILLL